MTFSFENGDFLSSDELESCTCIQDESREWANCPIHGKLQRWIQQEQGINPKYNGCISWRLLEDGRDAVLYPTVFGSRILIGPPGDMGGDEEFMFETLLIGIRSFRGWDGYGPPDGWVRWKCKDKIYRKGPDGQPVLSE